MRKNYLVRVLLLILMLLALACGSSDKNNPYILSTESDNKARDADFEVNNNPSLDKFTLRFTATEPGTGLIIVYTTDGKLVSREQVVLKKGFNAWDYRRPLRSNSIYWVKFTTGNIERTGKVVKSAYRQ
jgi:hypothetical protein